jgi:hypothetical protein
MRILQCWRVPPSLTDEGKHSFAYGAWCRERTTSHKTLLFTVLFRWVVPGRGFVVAYLGSTTAVNVKYLLASEDSTR